MINNNLIRRCSSQVKFKDKDDSFQFRLTHLYMQDKNISKIENLDNCINLTALYLFDNKIRKMENISHLVNLTELYLQNNYISKIENLENLKRLKKLYLNRNLITTVIGLNKQTELEELHLGNQNRDDENSLAFDYHSIQAVSYTLKILDICGNRVRRLNPLKSLISLEELYAEKNNIGEIHEISDTIKHWKRLKILYLTGNPVCKLYRYKDNVIISCPSLVTLDGKEITDVTRTFIQKMIEANSRAKKTTVEEPVQGQQLKTMLKPVRSIPLVSIPIPKPIVPKSVFKTSKSKASYSDYSVNFKPL
ncbi:protein phosphatase 1 regulatory subunit 42-like [Centruroides vittatus]|uniref:protein phosphatase 1 regulatory subunit 42-like n=1 Tax=Centruroides vittatus TaxID=120091 RepID=UPI00350F23F3